MKKIFYRMIFLMLLVFALMTTAQVSARVIIALPPPIIFAAPPEVVVLPGTYVYVVPDVPEDFFLQWLVVASVGRALVSFALLRFRVGLF